MPAFTFTSPDGKSYTVNGPDGATQEQAFGILQQQLGGGQQAQAPQPSVNPAVDFGRSIPRGMVSGFTDALANIGKSGAVDAQMSGVPTANPDDMATGQQGMEQIEQATGPMYKPQGRAGRVGAAIGEGLGNPTSYIGPGGLPLKIAGSVLSSAGGELGGQAAEGTGYEGAAKLGGALLGGAGAVKGFGIETPKALTPTLSELRGAKDAGYQAARESELVLKPTGPASFAANVEQELSNGPKYAFTGGEDGNARQTFSVLRKLQEPPEGSITTAANLDTLRTRLGDIAGETKEFKPTPDAKAAMVAKRRLAAYLQDIPDDHVLAGDPKSYSSNITEANGNNAAFERVKGADQRLTNAQDNTEGSITASLDNQIKSQFRNGYLRNPKQTRGFTQDEVGEIRDLNKGTLTSNVLRQLGRGGAGVIPMIAHAAIGAPIAAMTGGASLVPQAALAAALYGARKTAERMTSKQADRLIESLAQRSPLYQSRVNALPPADTITNKSALARALMNGLQQ